jgi:signal transduction histidine kinase
MRTQALNNTIGKLESEVIERKRAEEEARRSLERERELNELKSKFVSIASHEFRTPLSSVLSSASLIDQYNKRGEHEKINKHIHRIKSSVNQLTGILNDFLSLGKLEEGKVDIAHELITPADFLKEVKEEITGSLKDGQTLEINCGEKFPEIVVDPRILRNILFNLITNASKYSETHKSISLGCQVENELLIFEVADQGIGIPEEDQKHMFDRFFRASNAGTVQGTGLGLNIVKRYVELLNGQVSFTSTYGSGTTFKVILPLIKAL